MVKLLYPLFNCVFTQCCVRLKGGMGALPSLSNVYSWERSAWEIELVNLINLF